MLKMTCCAALLFLMPASALAETSGKIPREVIDHTAAHGGALVLVGLAVPWQLESPLEPRGPARAAHRHRLDTKRPPGSSWPARNSKSCASYQEIPGIALEVGAEALAELARLPIVTNVLLDRPAGAALPPQNRNASPRATAADLGEQRKSAVHSFHPRGARRHGARAGGLAHTLAARRRIERRTMGVATTRDP